MTNPEGALFERLTAISQPIFRQTLADWVLYYTPGNLVKVRHEQTALFENALRGGNDGNFPQASQLVQAAAQAQQNWQRWLHTPIEPVCLTLYMNRRCNLSCGYCFADPSPRDHSEISLSAIQSATRQVAANCAARHLPLVIIYHGGGEPTLSWHLIEQLDPHLYRLADEYGIPLFRYIATNAVLSPARASWLAKRVDKVGISCDGPAAIQDIQRPKHNGRPSHIALERSAHILEKARVPIQMRVTLTRESMLRQPEIAAYLCDTIHPQAIHVEQAYPGGRSGVETHLREEEVDAWLDAYREAQSIAQAHGITWEISTIRLNEIHGAYCHVFRGVANLVPGDSASACFKLCSAEECAQTGLATGALDSAGDFHFDRKGAYRLQTQYRVPQPCQGCFLQYHCTHGCPYSCPLLDQGQPNRIFCTLLQKLAARQLIAQADING
jgi:sulfatase maturation enzyme AslB (radical SAM superfamily)